MTISVLVLIASIILFIVLIIFVYKWIVTRSMNKALNTGERQGYIDIWQFVTIIGAAAIIILTSLSYASTNTLTEQVSYLENNVNNQSTEISYLRSIINYLQDDLNGYFDSSNPVQGFDSTLTNIETSGVTYHIDFSLLSIEAGAAVSLVLRDSNSVETIYPLTSQSLSFAKDVLLDSTETYTAYAYISGTVVTQYQLGKIYVSNDVDYRYQFEYYFENDSADSNPILTLSMYTSLVNPETLKTSSFNVKLYYDGVLQNETTMTSSTHENSAYETFIYTYQMDKSMDDYEKISMTITITDASGNVTIKTIGNNN